MQLCNYYEQMEAAADSLHNAGFLELANWYDDRALERAMIGGDSLTGEGITEEELHAFV